jgi:hypothetical protein
MRKREIVVGGVYADGTGNVREVIAEGPEHVICASHTERDNVRYRLIAKKASPDRVGDEKNTVRHSFASWAARKVEPSEGGTP